MSVPATIHNTLGLLFVTVVITATLYGAGMLQGWLYFRKYNKQDHWSVRALVAFVLVCDTIQEALICAAVYRYAVSRHDDPAAMLKMENTILIELYFGGALALAVQLFYCWRIHRLSQSWLLTGVLVFVSLAAFVLIYAYTCITINFPNLGELIKQQKFAIALNSTNAAADILITVSMIYCLHVSKTGFRRSTDLINRLIIFTFNTGIPTSLCALADVATCNLLPNTFIYMGFYLIMDRFYTNCLLVTLNSRKYIKDGLAGTDSSTRDTIPLGSRGALGNTARMGSQVHPSKNPISISIHESTTSDKMAYGMGYGNP